MPSWMWLALSVALSCSIDAALGAAATTQSSTSDSIATALDQARDDNERAVAAAKEKWIEVINQRIAVATDRGDLKTVKTLAAAKESAQSNKTLGDDVKDAAVLGAAKAYASAVKSADQKLTLAYQTAVREYTKAKKLELAEAVQQELDARNHSTTAPSGVASVLDHQRLGGPRGAPAYIQLPTGALGTRDGLTFTDHSVFARTKDGDFLKRDFTFEVLVSLTDAKEEIAIVGLGEATTAGGYAEPQNSVFMRIHSPKVAEGAVTLGVSGNDPVFDHIRNAGTHMLRVEKTGNSITFSIDVDYKAGSFQADLSRAIPDIRQLAPGLGDRNTFLFFGRGGTFRSVGLTKRSTSAGG